jgi:hypothetical protein
MTRDDFIHCMTAEAVPSDQFPLPRQREGYSNKWAVLYNGGAIVCCDTKENAEIAARLWTLSEHGVCFFNLGLSDRLKLVADLK